MLLASLFSWQCVTAASRWSMTMDEALHIPAGYIYWKLRDYSMNAEHPPLAKLLATVPLLLTDPRLPALDGSAWNAAHRFCFEDNETRDVLLLPRLVVVLLSLAAGGLVFLWGRKLLGAAGALLAAALYSLEPTVIAHSSLVTTDVPLALFFLASVAALWWCAERPTAVRTIVLGLVAGAALSTKYSAILLLPILVVLAALVVWRDGAAQGSNAGAGDARAPGLAMATIRSRAKAMARVLLVAVGIAFAVIWAVYGLSFAEGGKADRMHAAPVEEIIAEFNRRRVAVPRQPFAALEAHRVLPHPYLAGLVDVSRHSLRGHRAFLLGRQSTTGWPHYFVVTFLTKTPLPLLLILVLSLAVLLRTRWLPWRALAFLLVPVAVYFAGAAASPLNIGHRHLIPVIPFVTLLAASVLPAVRRLERRWRHGTFAVLAVLVAWNLFEAVRYRPHFIAYFNQLAGGPGNGYKVLADSNVDWGQDLYLLKRWVADNRADGLLVAYFGPAWPDVDARIPCRLVATPGLLPRSLQPVSLRDGDLLAISANFLDGLFVQPPGRFDFLRRYRPVARIGYSIFVFRISDEHLDRSGEGG